MDDDLQRGACVGPMWSMKCVIYVSGEVTTIMTPGDHGYNHAWYAVDGRTTFVFEVQSCGSAFIALSTYLVRLVT